MKTFTSSELGKLYNLSTSTISKRAIILGLKPKKTKKCRKYIFDKIDAERIINMYDEKKNFNFIRITETYYIYPSKMNYDTGTL